MNISRRNGGLEKSWNPGDFYELVSYRHIILDGLGAA
jgi:hypothetical protein